jgi:hypothetical protein
MNIFIDIAISQNIIQSYTPLHQISEFVLVPIILLRINTYLEDIQMLRSNYI